MIDWSLPAHERAALVTGVGRSPDSEGDVQEALARALWSIIVEPGDGDAGLLLGAVGAIEAARLLLEEPVPRRLVEATQGEVADARAKAAIARWLPRRRHDDLVRALRSAQRVGATLVVPGDLDWPASLGDLGPHAPVALWVRGDPALLRRDGIAVVGARAATGYGEHVAMELAAGLVQRDLAVVSGGAYGIDGMAHRAALASSGDTVAVLAGGVDRFYPTGHDGLLTRIAQQGAVVAEAPCGTAPTRWRFLERNRVIAALAGATVVVEAGRRSGALSTARAALKLGRPVGVVPGPITSAASAGCHAFLREQHAECVTSAAEAAALLPSTRAAVLEEPDAAEVGAGSSHWDPDGLRTRVLDALRPRREQSVDEIARAVGESAARIRSALGALALDDRAEAREHGWVRRAAPVG